ncbi:MAG: protein translocase subunit SecDF [Chitinophagales bacterium]|nr:protein translocase subunit SecDF [Chitinophagales bacterium]
MQNLRGVIKAFTYILIVVCLLQLSFTFVARYVEGKADDIASLQVNRTAPADLKGLALLNWKDSVDRIYKEVRRNYLDSVANNALIDVWALRDFYTYKFCREHALSLGLDLKGGMSLTMEIEEDDVLRKLSYNSKSEIFNKAIENAKKAQSTQQGDFLTLFKQEFEKLSPNAKLAAIFAPIEVYQGKININSTNDEVVTVLRKDFDAAIQNTFQVLKTRIDQFGVASPNISLQANTGRIILELPGVDDPARVRKLLQQTAQLEFWDTYETEEILNYLGDANTALRDLQAKEGKKTATTTDTAAATASTAGDLFGLEEGAVKTDTSTSGADTSDVNVNPLWDVLYPNVITEGQSQKTGDGPMVGRAFGKDTAKVNRLLGRQEIKALFPRDLKLLWGAHSLGNSNVYGLYAIKQNPATPEAPLTGEVINDAYQSFDQFGIPEVDITMNALGAAKWEKMTEAAVNGNVNGRSVKKCIAIVLDNRVFSAPRVQQKISGGRSQITGIDNLEEAIDLANILKSGKLEARTQVIEEQIIGPSLGAESIKAGLTSLAIGFILVFLFMVAYYSKSGIIADLAMLLNLFLLISILVSLGAAFTLPAMAGILLTLAMAVDANVIINERVREEITRGKGLRLAVEEGYQHSYSAIIDGQLTTMVVAIVLMVFGLGPIAGFGRVLFWGILTSLFTAVLVSRVLFDSAFNRNFSMAFGNKYTMNVLKGTKIDFMSKRKTTYIISAVVITLSLASIIFYGFDFGVDFKGGRSYVVQFDKDVKVGDVSAALTESLSGAPQVKTYGSNSQVSITTAYLIDSQEKNVDSIVESKIYNGVKGLYDEQPSFEDFRVRNVKSSIKIEASIADDIRRSALWAVFFGIAGVFIYIFIRFRRWQFATASIVALIHDPIIVLGVFSALRHVLPFSLEIDQNIVAAVLTLIGYSVNDTVVVFDRIRETINLHPTRNLEQNVNDSINQTLSRTIMTVMTVLIVSLVLFLFGGTAIRGFSFALIIGLLVGTYSSIFVASPVMVDLMNRKKQA